MGTFLGDGQLGVPVIGESGRRGWEHNMVGNPNMLSYCTCYDFHNVMNVISFGANQVDMWATSHVPLHRCTSNTTSLLLLIS